MGAFDIDNVAERIKGLYTYRLRVHPSRRYSNYVPPARWAYVWPKAASLCLEHGFDPEAHVRALMDERVGAKVFPNQLLGTRAVERTRAFIKRESIDEVISIQSQLSHLKGLVCSGANVFEALISPEEDFDAAVRYCFAVAAGLPIVASMFREDARLELRLNPRRLEALRFALPESFVQEVTGDDTSDFRASATPCDPSGS